MTERVRLTKVEIKERLRELEAKYGMSSDEFVGKYTTGELDGTRDFVRWMGLCRMLAATPGSRSRTASA